TASWPPGTACGPEDGSSSGPMATSVTSGTSTPPASLTSHCSELQPEHLEAEPARWPVPVRLLGIAPALIQAVRRIHIGPGRQDHGGEALVPGEDLAGIHEQARGAPAASRFVDREHPDLDLAGPAHVGKPAFRQRHGDGADELTSHGRDEDDRLFNARMAVEQQL